MLNIPALSAAHYQTVNTIMTSTSVLVVGILVRYGINILSRLWGGTDLTTGQLEWITGRMNSILDKSGAATDLLATIRLYYEDPMDAIGLRVATLTVIMIVGAVAWTMALHGILGLNPDSVMEVTGALVLSITSPIYGLAIVFYTALNSGRRWLMWGTLVATCVWGLVAGNGDSALTRAVIDGLVPQSPCSCSCSSMADKVLDLDTDVQQLSTMEGQGGITVQAGGGLACVSVLAALWRCELS